MSHFPAARLNGCLIVAVLLALMLAGCGRTDEHVAEGSGHHILQPLPQNPGPPQIQRLVYVPVYSGIYWGLNEQVSDLAATLSIRNVSLRHPIVIQSVRYNDSEGRLVREHLEKPGLLGPLSSADFVIQQRDRSGGIAASFLVEWSSYQDVDEPVIEAVMVGHQGSASLSFTNSGRNLEKGIAEAQEGR